MSGELRRTVVHIDAVVRGRHIICTPSGVDLPERCGHVDLDDLPETLRADAAPGKVFFAYVNLAAEHPSDLRIQDIEDHWGITDGLPALREGRT